MLTISIYLVAELLVTSSFMPLSPRALNSQSTTIPEMQEPGIETEFRSLSAGRGRKKDGTPFSFALYQSADRTGVSVTTEKYRTENAAKRALRKEMRHAVKVVDKATKLSQGGKRIGERAVVMFAAQGTSMAQATVLWTDGSDFHYIKSSSLQRALEFEKKFYR